MYTLEGEGGNTSPLYILCTLVPHIIPFPTLTLVHTWYEEIWIYGSVLTYMRMKWR